MHHELQLQTTSRIIQNKGGPWSSLDRAARNLQPTLSRLRNRKLPSIGLGAWQELVRLAENHAKDQLLALFKAVLTPQSLSVYSDYVHWLDVSVNERYPCVAGTMARYWMEPAGPELASLTDGRRATWVAREHRRDTWNELYYHVRKVDQACARMVQEFVTWARHRSHSRLRIRLSLQRVLGPLVEAADTGFMERSVDELTPDPMTAEELRSFVRHGLERERILLRRAPDDIRAQQLQPMPLSNPPRAKTGGKRRSPAGRKAS